MKMSGIELNALALRQDRRPRHFEPAIRRRGDGYEAKRAETPEPADRGIDQRRHAGRIDDKVRPARQNGANRRSPQPETILHQ